MKLRTGRQKYKLPEHSQILAVFVEGNQKYNQMINHHIMQMQPENFHKELNSIQGFPTVCACSHNRIEFWPIPDKPYIVRVQYLPPIKEY